MGNDETGAFIGAFIVGVATAILHVFLFSQVMESFCQIKHDVADCEWSRSPYTPTKQEVK